MIRLVILSASQLLPREIEFFCLDELSTRFQLEYWDCSAFLFPSFRVPEKVIRKDYLRIIPSLLDLRHRLMELPQDTVIVEDVFANKANYRFHKLLNSYFHSRIIVYFSTNTISLERSNNIDNLPASISGYKRIVQGIKDFILRSFTIKRVVTFLRYYNSPDYVTKVNHIFEVRTHQLSDYTIIACNSSFEWRINHPDYERYCRINAIDSAPISEHYIVFIDEYYPYLPEVEMGNPNLDIEKTAQMYYTSMNALFTKIENLYNCPVIIASHPRADYSLNNPYGGRAIIYNRTVELIKFSKACIIHNSNCYSYVVLYNKPVAAVINNALRASDLFTKYITLVNANLHVEVQDIDSIVSEKTEYFSYIDDSIRKRYIHSYLHDTTVGENSNTDLFTRYYNAYHSALISRNENKSHS